MPEPYVDEQGNNDSRVAEGPATAQNVEQLFYVNNINSILNVTNYVVPYVTIPREVIP